MSTFLSTILLRSECKVRYPYQSQFMVRGQVWKAKAHIVIALMLVKNSTGLAHINKAFLTWSSCLKTFAASTVWHVLYNLKSSSTYIFTEFLDRLVTRHAENY